MVEARLRELFPDLPSGTVKTFWGGRIAMTVDRLPHLHKRDDGLYSWIGCNGRGLTLMRHGGCSCRCRLRRSG